MHADTVLYGGQAGGGMAPITARSIEVVHGRPPNFQAIATVFPEAFREGVIFTYAPKAYFTGKGDLSRELKAHEAVHANRQLDMGGPDAWWERYLVDPGFRLHEELLAHRAEWQAFTRRHGPGVRFLNVIAARLAGPLYGKMLTVAQAKHAIVTGELPA